MVLHLAVMLDHWITIQFLLTSSWIWEKTWGCEKGAVGEIR